MPDAAADSLMCRSCTSPDSGPEYQNLGINGLEDRRQGAREEDEGTEQPKSGFAQNFQRRGLVGGPAPKHPLDLSNRQAG
jgi:hypothetical protein